MKAAIPYLGTATVALKMFCEELGAEVVLPPVPTRRTIELGVRHSPEQICLPFKITLGNLIEALELGADTAFMASGTRKCRFGYYHLVQQQILGQLFPGCRLFGLSQYSAVEFVGRRLPEIFGVTRSRALAVVWRLLVRSALVHEFDNMVRALRAQDFLSGEDFRRQGVARLAETRRLADVQQVRRGLVREFAERSRGLHTRPRARIGLVGEVYLILEPFANSEIEKELGRLGVLVQTERSLYKHLRHLLKSDPSFWSVARYARRYLGESPGGEVIKTLGEAVKYARAGVDGIIHIFPFTCMPENMGLEMLQQIGREYDVPVMSLSFDEHSGKTGLVTRLEAFVDMLVRRRTKRPGRSAA